MFISSRAWTWFPEVAYSSRRFMYIRLLDVNRIRRANSKRRLNDQRFGLIDQHTRKRWVEYWPATRWIQSCSASVADALGQLFFIIIIIRSDHQASDYARVPWIIVIERQRGVLDSFSWETRARGLFPLGFLRYSHGPGDRTSTKSAMPNDRSFSIGFNEVSHKWNANYCDSTLDDRKYRVLDFIF